MAASATANKKPKPTIRVGETRGYRSIVEGMVNSGTTIRRAREQLFSKLRGHFATRLEEKNYSFFEGVRIGDLWDTFVGPRRMLVGEGSVYAEAEMLPAAFNVLTGNLIQQAVIKEYDLVSGLVGDQLIRSERSTLPVETYSGTTAIDDPQEVDAGEEYPWANFDERSTQAPEPKKKGNKLGISREMVLFDRTGEIMRRAGGLGKVAAQERERMILKTITDHAGYKRYYPKKITGDHGQEDLYRLIGAIDATTAYKRHATTQAITLTDFASIGTALQNFAARTDEKGRNIFIQPKVLLVPFALVMRAAEALKAITVRREAYAGGGASTENRSQYSPAALGEMFRILGGAMPGIVSSPILDSFAADATGTGVTNTTTWYIGDPKECFLEQVHWPITVFSLTNPSQLDFDRDVVTAYKVSRKSAVNVVTDAYWLRCT